MQRASIRAAALGAALTVAYGAGGQESSPPVQDPASASGDEDPGAAGDRKVRSETTEFQGVVLHWLEAGPASAPLVLLLHGARFHAGTWKELGTLELLAERGFRAVALDLPGHGESQPMPEGTPFVLWDFLVERNIQHPVVVAPSMSGAFALPLVTEHADAVAALVAVAPVGIPAHLEKLRKHAPRILALWGEKDTVVPLKQAEELVAAVPSTVLVVLEGASHPCYLDRPDEFHQALLEFLQPLGER